MPKFTGIAIPPCWHGLIVLHFLPAPMYWRLDVEQDICRLRWEHFGPRVHLCNVRLEEVLRVEIFRRGLHSDAFAMPNLRPAYPDHHNI